MKNTKHELVDEILRLREKNKELERKLQDTDQKLKQKDNKISDLE